MTSIGNDTMAPNDWIRVNYAATHFREVKMDLVGHGMDNQYRMTFKKDERGDYKISCHGQAFGNFQIKCGVDDLEWIADDGDWKSVVDKINSGVKTVTGIKAR
jgi:hypothetical protein